MIAVVILGTSLEGVVGVFLLRDRLHMTPTGYAIAIAAWSVGMLAAGAAVKPSRLSGHDSALAASACVLGCGIALPAVLLHSAVVAPAFLIGGAANGVFNVALTVTLLERVDDAEQGRAWAAFGMLANTSILAGYLGGAALGKDSARTAMLLAGAVPLLTGAFSWSAGRAGPVPGRNLFLPSADQTDKAPERP
jgi:hypothetical protein